MLEAEAVEKLSNILGDERCPDAIPIITLMLLNCARNGCKFLPMVFSKIETLFDHKEHSIIATLILHCIVKTQPLPISSVTKLCKHAENHIQE